MDYPRALRMECVLTEECASLPRRLTSGAAGYDLTACQIDYIEPGEKGIIKTGLKIKIPEGYHGEIWPRSSLAANRHIGIGGGIIDSDFRGEIHIIIFNHSKRRPLSIHPGDRVAQLLIKKNFSPDIVQVTELDRTARGSSMGSTAGQPR